MNLPFRRQRHLTELIRPSADERHVITSGYSNARCRFVLECTCGDHFDTPYIDEALEYREMHELLAPLADQLQP